MDAEEEDAVVLKRMLLWLQQKLNRKCSTESQDATKSIGQEEPIMIGVFQTMILSQHLGQQCLKNRLNYSGCVRQKGNYGESLQSSLQGIMQEVDELWLRSLIKRELMQLEIG